MSIRIQGLGWVTPLGRELSPTWNAIKAGGAPIHLPLTNPFTAQSFPVYRVDPETITDAARHPRLRRSSVISHFAVAAALDALRDAGCDAAREKIAIVFAATNGGVIYTRRFFEEVSKTGTHAGSPLLFPETVYNAPASHVAAVVGNTGTTTTLVNDATAGMDAISTACELLEAGSCDRCLVVAAEEADWAICEAYATWRLAAPEPPIVPFSSRGTIFAEGAAALLLGRHGDGPAIETVQTGTSFSSIADARRRLAAMMPAKTPGLIVSSVSGTPFDEAETARTPWMPKVSLGEAFAASSIMQAVCAVLALRENAAASRALIPVVGFHGRLAALTLRA